MSFQKASLGQVKAYAFYSKYRVGAYLESKYGGATHGRYAGNVESGSASCNICAERLVIAQALLNREEPNHLYLVTPSEKPTPPCGTCLQFMSEWPTLKITMYSRTGTESITKTVAELLPFPYSRKS